MSKNQNEESKKVSFDEKLNQETTVEGRTVYSVPKNKFVTYNTSNLADNPPKLEEKMKELTEEYYKKNFLLRDGEISDEELESSLKTALVNGNIQKNKTPAHEKIEVKRVVDSGATLSKSSLFQFPLGVGSEEEFIPDEASYSFHEDWGAFLLNEEEMSLLEKEEETKGIAAHSVTQLSLRDQNKKR